MSTNIDERVVEMRFDNKTFEQNAQTSMSTIDKLKQKLKFEDSVKSLESLEKASKSIDFNPIANAAEAVTNKFSVLGTMADQMIRRITDSIMASGKRLISAITTVPIKSGLQEYETQLNSVQTILANTESKGSTLDDVNAALAELNTYADKTIYNFTEMTRNIGTFTAAGVELDTAVQSIKGIANLAAVSGSNSQQASTAMYQLSQALAAGTIRLQDWNSVVNAGMGGELFQNALVRTAAVMAGSANDVEAWRQKNIEAYGSFRESLTRGAWLTTDVLTQTLKQLAGDMSEADLKAAGYTDSQISEIMKLGTTAQDAATKVKTFTQLIDTLKESLQSGWTQSWQYVIGDFGEAKEFWTKVSDAFGGLIQESADARNAILKTWHDGIDGVSGYQLALESLHNVWVGFTNILSIVRRAWQIMFPTVTAERLIEITAHVRDATEAFANFFAPLKDVGDTVSSALDPVVEAVTETAEATEDALQTVYDIQALADAVIRGDYGNGNDRYNALEAMQTGLYGLVQDQVNARYGIETHLADESAAAIVRQTEAIEEQAEAEEEVTLTLAEQRAQEAAARQAELEAHVAARHRAINLQNTITGLLSGVRILVSAFVAAKRVIGGFISSKMQGVFERILAITGSIGEKLTEWSLSLDVEFFTEKLENLVAFLQSAGDAVRSFIDRAKSLESVQKLFGYFKQAKDWAFDKITSLFSSLSKIRVPLPTMEQFLNVLDWIVQGINFLIESASNGVVAIKDFFSGFSFPKGEEGKFDAVLEFFNNIFSSENVQEMRTKASEVFTQIFQGIRDALSNFSFGKALGVAGAGGLIYSIFMLGEVFRSIKKFISGGASITEGVAGVLEGTKDVLEGYAQSLKADALLKIAEAIGILAVSILVLSLIPEESLMNVAVALTVVLGILTGLAKSIAGIISAKAALNPFSKGLTQLAKGFKKIGAGVKGLLKNAGRAILFQSLAMSILILAGAFAALAYVFTKMDPEAINKAITFMIVTFVALIAAAIILSKFASNMVKVGGSLVGMSLSLLILVGAFAVLIKVLSQEGMTEEKIKNAKKIIWSFGLLLIAFSVASKYAQGVGKTGFGLLLVSSAIALLLLALSGIGQIYEKVSWSALGKMGAVLAAFLASLVVITVLSRKLSGFEKDFAILLGGIATLVLALYAISRVADVFNSISWNTIGKMGATLGGLVVAMLALVAISKIGGGIDWKSFAGIGVAMVALSAGLLLMAQAMAIMASSGNNWESFGMLMATLVGSLVLLAAAAFVVGKLKIDGAMLKIGAAMALAGVGILAFAVAVDVLGENAGQIKTVMVAFAEGLVGVMQVIMDNLPTIIKFVGVVILAICAAIIAKKVLMSATLVSTLVSLGQTLIANAPILLGILGTLLAMLLDFLGVNVEPVINFLGGMVIKIINGLTIFILENGDQIWYAIGNLLMALGNFLIQGIKSIISMFPGGDVIAQKIDDFLCTDGMIETVRENNAEIDRSMEQSKADMISTANDFGEETSTALSGAYDNIASAANGSESVVAALSDTTTAIDTAGAETTASANTFMDGLISAFTAGDIDASGFQTQLTSMINSGLISSEDAANAVGGAIPEGLQSGIEENSDLPLGALDTMTTEEIQALIEGWDTHSPSQVTTDIGKNVSLGLANGIYNGSSMVLLVINGVILKAYAAFNNLQYKTWYAGYYGSKGLANGIKYGAWAVYNAANDIANTVSRTIQNALDEHSPSRVTEQLGIYAGEGLAIGISSTKDQVKESSETAADAAVESMKSVASRIYDVLTGQIDIDPTIRPILDLTNIRAGAQEIGSLLNGTNMPYASKLIGNISNSMNNMANRAPDTNVQSKVELTNNFYVQKMDEGMVDYFVNRINTELGARV